MCMSVLLPIALICNCLNCVPHNTLNAVKSSCINDSVMVQTSEEDIKTMIEKTIIDSKLSFNGFQDAEKLFVFYVYFDTNMNITEIKHLSLVIDQYKAFNDLKSVFYNFTYKDFRKHKKTLCRLTTAFIIEFDNSGQILILNYQQNTIIQPKG